MSGLYIILAVILLVAAIFISSMRLKLGNEQYKNTHPPKKQQEEFLKACELYLEYRKDPAEHPKPAKDAKRDAGLDISSQGYLPACLKSTVIPRGAELKWIVSEDASPAYMTYQAIETVSQQTFCECQTQDGLLTGYSQDPRFWKETTFDIDGWKRYCCEMSEAFNQLVDRYLTEVQDETVKGPKINLDDPS